MQQVLYDMIGIVGSLVTRLETDVLIDFIQKTLYRLLGVHVPTKLVRSDVGFAVPLNIEQHQALRCTS